MTTMKAAEVTTFTLNGVGYAKNEKTGYCFRYVDIVDETGKKNRQSIRISKSEFNKALQAHEDEVDAKMHEAIERLVEEQDNAEIQRIQKEMTASKKKKSAPRTKKVQVGGMEFAEDGVSVIITPRQVEFIRLLPTSNFWENGVDSALWIDCLCDDLEGKMAPMTIGAMVSTLREKGLLVTGEEKRENRKVKFFQFTDTGKAVVAKVLGL